MSTLRERVDAVTARVRAAEVAANRAHGSVRLIGASKRRTAAEVQDALGFGIRHFGENYVPELLDKVEAVDGGEWHFIGHLQRNKARRLLDAGVGWIHTVDTPRLAATLQRLVAGRRLRTLIQVNIGEESSKSGVLPSEVPPLVQNILNDCPDIGLCGLMAIPPRSDAPAHWFTAMADLRDRLEQRFSHPFPELSMGMSRDLEAAIGCGATMVRVGTALFGARD